MIRLRPATRPERLLQALPLGAKVGLIVAIFVAIVVCLLVLADLRMEVLTGTRAYVGGEGLWSKGQKEAVHELLRYAESRDARDWGAYLAAVAVPLGDRQARLELERRIPDMTRVRDGFVQGRNSPDDVPAMAWLFRRFRRVGYMGKAIAIWSAGDRDIEAIRRQGDVLHREIASALPNAARVDAAVAEIERLNEHVTRLEDAFSRTLAKGARRAAVLLSRVTYAATLLLLALGVLLSWLLLRNIRAWEARYRHLLDTANDAILVATLDSGVILEANRKAEELVGIPVRRLIGMRQQDLHPRDERDRYVAFMAEAGRAGRATGRDVHVRHADGRRIPVEVSAAVTEVVGRPVVQSIVRDVTDRHRAEQALRESEERYRGLFENATDLVYTHDLEGNFLTINRAVEAVTGYTADEARRLKVADIVVPEQIETVRTMIERKLLDGTPTVYELEVIAKDGQRVPVEVSTRLILADGKPVGVQGIARDITERRRIERERADLLAREQLARAEAERANRAKDEFLATLSHELRTPLSAILIWSRLLRSGRLDEASAARALEVIEGNTKLQSRLIEDLLDVSRIVTGKLRLETAPVDVAATVEAAIESVRAAADAKSVRLECGIDYRLGPVSGDRNRLQQIVWNLVSNAIKFTPAGGRVEVRLARDGESARLVVRDTGIGIAPEFLPHIFERFRQADSSSTRAHAGLGLGLAIVRHLVDLHGGTVDVESAGPGLGATFTVTLPLIAQEAAGDAAWLTRLAADELPAAGSLAGVEVVVIDDEAHARDAVAAVLDVCGARVRTAASAAEGLAAVDALSLANGAVVLCDIGMPGEDGYAFIGKLRARPADRGGDIPAGALTAYARDDDRARTLAAGYQLHLAKPIDPAALVAAVSKLRRVKRPATWSRR